MPAYQEALAYEPIYCLAYGNPRDTEIGGEVPLGRKRVVCAEDVPVHGLAQRALQLLVQRQIAGARKRANRFREAHYAAGSFVPDRWLV
jgi:hypothetical protein